MAPPRRASFPNYLSTASYWREGRRHARAAIRQFPDQEMPNALISYLESGGPLKAATVLRYTEDCRRLLTVWERRFELGAAWFDDKFSAVLLALDGRRIRKRRKRGEKANRTLATEPDFRLILDHLLDQYTTAGAVTPLVAAFSIYSLHVTGMRPVELIGAEVQGVTIKIRNAKRVSGQPEFRQLDISGRHVLLPTAMEMFLEIIRVGVDSRHQFDRLRDRLSESVARACQRLGLPRFSLYSFRHLAMAIWTEKGIGASVIAQMAGHFSDLTAARNYARNTHGGWDPRSVVIAQMAAPIPEIQADVSAAVQARAETISGKPGSREYFRLSGQFRRKPPATIQSVRETVAVVVPNEIARNELATESNDKAIISEEIDVLANYDGQYFESLNTIPHPARGIGKTRELVNQDIRRGPKIWQEYKAKLEIRLDAELPSKRIENNPSENLQSNEKISGEELDRSNQSRKK